MLKYKILSNNVIEVDLENNYKVIALANWNNVSKKYYVSLMIHEKTINNWSLMEKYNNLEFTSNIKYIKHDMAKYISDLHKEGSFQYYINRYEYELKCFDKGDEFFEKERNLNGGTN